MDLIKNYSDERKEEVSRLQDIKENLIEIMQIDSKNENINKYLELLISDIGDMLINLEFAEEEI